MAQDAPAQAEKQRDAAGIGKLVFSLKHMSLPCWRLAQLAILAKSCQRQI
jgi:hypothetical protein